MVQNTIVYSTADSVHYHQPEQFELQSHVVSSRIENLDSFVFIQNHLLEVVMSLEWICNSLKHRAAFSTSVVRISAVSPNCYTSDKACEQLMISFCSFSQKIFAKLCNGLSFLSRAAAFSTFSSNPPESLYLA